MNENFSQNYIVTGATGSLGRQLCQVLLAQDNRLCIIGRDRQKLEELQCQAPSQVVSCAGDLKDPLAAQRCIDYAAEQLGSIHGLIHLIGQFPRGTFQQSSFAQFREALEVNFLTALHITQPLLPQLAHGASLIYLSSFLVDDPLEKMAAYASSKAALVAWARTLARELRPFVRVNVVSTTILDGPRARAHLGQRAHEHLVHPADIADVISFLLSPAAQSINGAIVPVYKNFGLENVALS